MRFDVRRPKCTPLYICVTFVPSVCKGKDADTEDTGWAKVQVTKGLSHKNQQSRGNLQRAGHIMTCLQERKCLGPVHRCVEQMEHYTREDSDPTRHFLHRLSVRTVVGEVEGQTGRTAAHRGRVVVGGSERRVRVGRVLSEQRSALRLLEAEGGARRRDGRSLRLPLEANPRSANLKRRTSFPCITFSRCENTSV